MSAFHRLMISELVSSADHVAGRRYIASAGVRWCGAGGVRKDVYLSDTHINYAKTITGTAPGVPGRSCALPASRGARLARNIALPCVPVLSPSFLPSFLPHLLPCLSHTFLFATHDACFIHQQAALHTKAAPRHQKKTMGVVVSLALSSPAAALTPVNRLSALNSNALLRSP